MKQDYLLNLSSRLASRIAQGIELLTDGLASMTLITFTSFSTSRRISRRISDFTSMYVVDFLDFGSGTR